MKNKFIGLRQFQRDLMENLPQEGERLILTRYGKPVAVVLSLSVDDLKLNTNAGAKTVIDVFGEENGHD